MMHQSVDQAAYRKGFSTDDHLLTVSTLIEKSYEFNHPLWIALVDFEKAFDTVDHPTLWKVLQEQGVPNHYIALLQSLYQGQIAYVKADVKSRSFSISRGVKQGDPISALLFIAVMQDCFGKLQSRWQDLNEKRSGVKYGIRLARGQLTNLRFADDVILVAQQRADIRKMLVDLQTFSRKYRLKIHLGKTKVMTWNALVCGSPFVLLGGDRVEILEETCSERYLGRKLCFSSSMETELNNRIAAGWATFHKHKGELCNKFYRLEDRVRLFESTVTPTVLYASATWALTQCMERKLITARRRMLRYVFRIHRKRQDQDNELENWVQFVQNSAHSVDRISETHGLKCWVHTYRLRKWQFAGQLARQQDHRWSRQILEWKPNGGLGRSQGAPKTRWEDQIVNLAGGSWMQLATDENLWAEAGDVFANRDF